MKSKSKFEFAWIKWNCGKYQVLHCRMADVGPRSKPNSVPLCEVWGNEEDGYHWKSCDGRHTELAGEEPQKLYNAKHAALKFARQLANSGHFQL